MDLPTDRLEADEYDTEGRVNGHRSEGPADTVAKSSGQMQNKVDSGAQPPGSVTTDAVHRVTNPKEEDHEGDEEELLRGGASGLGSTTGQGDNSNWACARTQNQNPCSAASLGPPTVSEALKRLRLTCFKEMAGRMPVNPELAPKEAIRVAEALVPYPTGIRFDKSTFRYDEKAVNAKNLPLFPSVSKKNARFAWSLQMVCTVPRIRYGRQESQDVYCKDVWRLRSSGVRGM